MIERLLDSTIKARLFKGKAIILMGARQTGKSTLTEALVTSMNSDWMSLNGDDADVRAALTNTSTEKLRAILGNKKILLINEAQRIENIGLTLKIITDQISDVQAIATGSSAFELSNKLNEPLTGRKYEYFLYPLSFEEMVNHHGLLQEKRLIEQRLIYGSYPEIVTHPGDEKERLKLLANSYLYKDLLMLEDIKKPALLERLLRALALQIGQEVNYTELGQLTSSDRKTVEKYIDLLEKAFVVFQLPSFSRNARNEIKKAKKVYFFDCGIRNAVINNFKPLGNRTDVGPLWENYIIVERLKYLRYHGDDAKLYFWRTAQQQEIDLIEESEEMITAYEFKWNAKAKVKTPQTFLDAYPGSKVINIHPGNMEEVAGII